MNKKSLGLVETWGIVGAVEAADAGLKAANVELIGYELNKAGFATAKFVGDVSAVATAVAAGRMAASKVAQVVGTTVIPRPDDQLAKVTTRSPDNVPPLTPPPAPIASKEAPEPVPVPEADQAQVQAAPEEDEAPAEEAPQEVYEEEAGEDEAEDETAPPSGTQAASRKKGKGKGKKGGK